jgi:hypothetical protein
MKAETEVMAQVVSHLTLKAVDVKPVKEMEL